MLVGSLLLAALALAAPPNPPTISGEAQVGKTLTASGDEPGAWQWLYCTNDDCTTTEDIPGAIGSTYELTSADVNRRLKVRLTAPREGAPDESAESSPVGPVAPPPPPPPNPPKVDSVTIIGTPHVAKVLTATAATSGGAATSAAWQWSRCTSTCQPIATTQSYTVVSADAGKQLKAEYTVSNTDGTHAGSDTVTVANPPAITEAPEILPNSLDVGTQATTTAEWRDGTRHWQWLLCNTATVGLGCAEIVGATARSYVVKAADAGSWLAVRLTVTGSGPDAVAYSDGKFIPKPPDPPPPPPSTPFTSTGTTPETPTVQPTISAPTLLNPFPVIRIRGRTTRRGAQLTLLSVRAPRGARINVRCKSRYCPRSRLALNARLRRLRVFERSLRAGVVLEIRVMHAKRIGKYTRFLIRRAAPPLRRDACLAPGSRRPTRCPGG